jgi:cytochrome c biogenesis protein CcmG/thiol:disulfide interchange protein DsbE
MNWKRALIPAVVIIPILIVIASQFGTNPHEVPFGLAGKPAPEFTLTTLDGQTLTSSDLQGKPTVINFWSTWCVPCKVEHDVLQLSSRRYRDSVRFLGVIYQDDADAARTYLRMRSNFYTQVIDPDSTLAIQYGVSGVPESYFIDAQGIVRYKQVGPVTHELLGEHIGALSASAARATP